jgi:hypothetical protein
VNDRDVRALGWLVTRDACLDVVRVATGRRPPASLPATVELTRRWEAVTHALAEDRPTIVPRWVESSTTLTPASEAALRQFAELLLATYPGRYEWIRLRARFVNALSVAAAFAACGSLLAWARGDLGAPPELALVAFGIACVQLVSAVQLRRAEVLVRRVTAGRREVDSDAVASTASPYDDASGRKQS